MIIDGKRLAHERKASLPDLSSRRVCFISFHRTPQSDAFMRIKSRVAAELGIDATIFHSEAITTEEACIEVQKHADLYDGIVVQLPLQQNFDTERILNTIPQEKDIDMLSSNARIAFEKKETRRIPPVAWSVFEILHESRISVKDKRIVIVGSGRLVGEPVAMMCKNASHAYSVIDIHTPHSEKEIWLREADVIISGIGVPHYIKPHMIKEHAVLIDAGTSEQEGKIVGDIHPDCAQKASLFTPVPGGVGPLTVVGLFNNLQYTK